MKSTLRTLAAGTLAVATLVALSAGSASAAPAKKKTITCYKLTATSLLTKKVKGAKPVCPMGYTKVKPNLQGTGVPGDPDLNVPGSATISMNGSSFDAPFVSFTTSGQYAYNAGGKVSFSSYPAAGSGTGRTQITNGTVQIGYSDQPMANSAKTVPSGVSTSDYVQVPYVLGGGIVGYHLGAGFDGLKLSADVIAKIFNGQITTWSDPQIVALNPGTVGQNLKNLASANQSLNIIKVVYRAASSGTTYAFTDYLKKAAPNSVPAGLTPSGNVMEGSGNKWGAPNIVAAANNAALATELNSQPGSIGYIEYSYVLIPGNAAIQVAQLQDANGQWLSPSLTNIAAAAQAAGTSISPENFSIVYEPGNNVWPFATYSWAIVKKSQSSATTGAAIVKYLDWATHGAQTNYAKANGYVPLPGPVQAYARAQLQQVTSGGSVLLNSAKTSHVSHAVRASHATTKR